jgi:hypothetical protein
MNEDQSYWYERGLHAGKVLAAEAQGYKEAYFALVEAIAKNEALLPRQTILIMPQRTWVGLDPEEIRKTNHHMVDGAYHYSFKQGAEWAEAKLKEKNT